MVGTNAFAPPRRFGTRGGWSGQLGALARDWGDETSVGLASWTSPSEPVAVAVAPASPAVAAPPRRAERPRPGWMGRYRLVERIGRGRQADVWRAADEGAGGGMVALKVLPAAEVDRDPRRRAQLRREAERGARLDGPSLLPTYEYGEEAGAAFMAMPLVAGCTLADVIAQRQDFQEGRHVGAGHRLAFASEASYDRDVAALMARVARAAHDAHRGLVAHRDIKPGNVLLRHDHAAGVFLCDFGLARDLDVATPGQLRDGAGSPLYMAPERLLKRPADEVRCDVFALGVTLCEALALRPPVGVPDGLPRAQWAAYLATTPPRTPSQLRPTVPPELEAVVLRATDRDPARRYPNAYALADDLLRFLAAGPPPRPDWDE